MNSDQRICDPNRLRKVAKVCEDFEMRRQYSVVFLSASVGGSGKTEVTLV
jgi:CRISPR/Cas system-associated endoribonuclease Cas2